MGGFLEFNGAQLKIDGLAILLKKNTNKMCLDRLCNLKQTSFFFGHIIL